MNYSNYVLERQSPVRGQAVSETEQQESRKPGGGKAGQRKGGRVSPLSYKKSVIYIYLLRKSRIPANERISVTYLRIVRVLHYGFRPMDVFQQRIYEFCVLLYGFLPMNVFQ